MYWFGESWGASVCTPERQVDNPAIHDTESTCAWCTEGMDVVDTGFVLPIYDSNESAVYHRNCYLRSVIGSVSHQRGQCSCFGGEEEDFGNLTLRQAADAAVELFYGNHEPAV